MASGGGVGQILMLADIWGGGVWTTPFLSDVICEQPLIDNKKLYIKPTALLLFGILKVQQQQKWFDQLRAERTLYKLLRGNHIEQQCYTENVSVCAPPVQKLEPNLLPKKTYILTWS